jgi:hypothetical protein
MNRTALAAAALAALATAVAGSSTLLAPAQGGDCPELLPRQPLVAYDVSGHTLLGPSHLHLAVYSDGLASISRVGGSAGDAAMAFLSPREASELLTELRSLGAYQQCDSDLLVLDVPLTTITVHGTGADPKAHSFSYWLPETAQLAAIQAALDAFVARHFPDF